MAKNLIRQVFWKSVKTEGFGIDFKWLKNVHHIPAVCHIQ